MNRHRIAALLGLALLPVIHAGRLEPGNTPDPRSRTFSHIPWAIGNEEGAPRVLFIVNGQSASEVYELAMRMDLDYDVFYTNGGRAGLFAPETDYYHEGIRLFPEAVAELRDLLADDWEVLAFVDCNPYTLPPELHYRVLEKIVGGSAAVCFNSCRWQESFRFPGIKSENVTDLFQSMPGAGLTFPEYRQKEAVAFSQIGTLLPISYESVTAPYTFSPVVVRTVGKGRIYEFKPGGGNYFGGPAIHPAKRQDPAQLLQNEYFYGLGAKLLLMAAGRTPDVSLKSLDAAVEAFEPGKPLGLTANLSGPFTGKARVVARTPWNEVRHETTVPVRLGAAGALPVALPALPAGNYYIDAWLTRKGKVVDWASVFVTVRSATTQIAALTLTATSFPPDGDARATITLKGVTPGMTLSARVRDAGERVLVEAAGIRPTGKEAQVALPLARTREQYHVLEVDLVADNVVLDTRREWFCVPRAWEKDLFVFTDDGGRNLYGDRRRRMFRELGITTCETGSDATQIDPRPVLASGQRISTRIWTTHCNQYTGGCIASPTYPAGLSARFESVARFLQPYGLTFFSVGDDSGVASDLCTSYPNWVRSYIRKLSIKYGGDFKAFTADHFPQGTRKWGAWRYMAWQGKLAEILALDMQPDEFELMRESWRENYGTVAEFNRAGGTSFESFDAITKDDLAKIGEVSPCLLGLRDSMKARHGSIAKLNAAWGTDLADFEAITNEGVEALVAAKKYGAKLDKTWYLEDLFIRNMSTAAEGVRRVSSEVGIGMGAATLPNIIPDVLEHIDSIMPYKGDRDIEVIRSFPHRFCGQTIGVYGGKKVPAAARENQAWETVLSGGNFIWFWSMCTGGVMGDWSMNPGRSGVMLENIREMQGGIARALIRADRLHDGIGILHQRRAGGLASFVKDLGSVFSSQTAFQHVIEDLGMQYRYTSTKEVEGGVLASGEFKVLILPYTQVLSDAEVTAITDFVRAGGALLADLRPATHDWQGRPRTKGALDDVFGITQDCATPVPVKGDMAWTSSVLGEPLPQPARASGIRGDGTVKAKGAHAVAAIGDTPMVLVNTVGKGKAMLLNHAPTTYEILLNRGGATALRKLYRSLFELGDVQRRHKVVDRKGADIAGAELALFRNGAIDYLTLEKQAFEFEQYPIESRIELGRQADVYNTRTGEHVGLTDTIPVTLTGLGCYVYTLLPYRATGFDVDVPKRVKQGGNAEVEMAIRSKGGAPGPHTVRVDVFRPDGNRLWPMYKTETVAGTATVKLPIADNEQLGKWRIVATDVTTGRGVERGMKVTK